MPSRLSTIACILIGLLILSVSALAQDTLPAIQWSDCPFEAPVGETEGETLDCGTLITYEDHFSSDDSAQVELAFAILYSLNDPAPDPVIYLEGGPGGSALTGVDGWVDSAIRTNRDLILIDQRGTGYSIPSLNCIEDETYEGDNPLEADQACHDRLVSEGINLNAYNSAQSAADIADLMALLPDDLDYSEYNLLGISYGTRLALTMMRDDPQGIRSAIIDSVYPPNANAYDDQAVIIYRGLRQLFDGCAADPACDNAYPNLEAVFYDTYDSLNASPVTYNVEDPETGEVSEQDLTGDSFLDLIVQALYSTTAIPELPLVIYEVSEGNYDVAGMIDTGEIESNFSRFVPLRQTDDQGDISDSEGMFNAVECQEEVPFNNLDNAVAEAASVPEPIRDYLVASIENQFAVCDIYNLNPADSIETQPVTSDIPTLVLAGAYDPITPPVDAQLAASTLSHSYYFEFPGHGHGITDSDDCAKSIVASFLDNPAVQPDGSCLDNMPGPAFIIR